MNSINFKNFNTTNQFEFYEKRSPLVYGIFLRYCLNTAKANEQLQKFFVNVLTGKYKISNDLDQQTHQIKRYAIGYTLGNALRINLEEFAKITPENKTEHITSDDKITKSEDPIINAVLKTKEKTGHLESILFNLFEIEQYSEQQIISFMKNINKNQIFELSGSFKAELGSALGNNQK